MRSSSRLLGAALIVGSLGLAFAIRLVTGPLVEATGPLDQISGTALYASAFYGGVLVLWPRGRPLPVALISTGYCWAVEFFQLTGVPTALSAHSVVARLVLGRVFDSADLLWYVVGVLLAGVVHYLTLCRRTTA
ncbi:DUF2809 domain-containing protein [Actinoplanes subtropicus]|uniref:ribosomal maturation YjgA family protein n=1 Tax=Actinoplanes subtropicus TaxID=543632 RepID=UPI0005592A11|nr:DUF2809 domain-containing protein [Actinoplanes subtropicus]